MIFGSSKMLYIASLIAYVIGNTPKPSTAATPIPQNFFWQHLFSSAHHRKRQDLLTLSTQQSGNLCDIWLFGIIKKATNGKLLWLRATGTIQQRGGTNMHPKKLGLYPTIILRSDLGTSIH